MRKNNNYYYGICKTPNGKFFIQRSRLPNDCYFLCNIDRIGECWVDRKIAIATKVISFFDSEEEAEFVLKDIDNNAEEINKPPKRIRRLNKHDR